MKRKKIKVEVDEIDLQTWPIVLRGGSMYLCKAMKSGANGQLLINGSARMLDYDFNGNYVRIELIDSDGKAKHLSITVSALFTNRLLRKAFLSIKGIELGTADDTRLLPVAMLRMTHVSGGFACPPKVFPSIQFEALALYGIRSAKQLHEQDYFNNPMKAGYNGASKKVVRKWNRAISGELSLAGAAVDFELLDKGDAYYKNRRLVERVERRFGRVIGDMRKRNKAIIGRISSEQGEMTNLFLPG